MHDGGAQQSGIDIGVVMELLGSMKATLGTLNQARDTLSEQGSRVKELGPTMNSALGQLEDLRNGIDEHDAQRATAVSSLKGLVRREYRNATLDNMRELIRRQIRSEVERQTASEIDTQLADDYLQGTSLEKQVEDGRAQVTAMRAAVQNSKARQANSPLTWSEGDMAALLGVVVRPDGTPSPRWPANLTSLLAFEDEEIVKLRNDYGLDDTGDRLRNINGFLAYIGVVAVRLAVC
ncbi:hypothetical protein C8Q77DRAFT_1057032 [Trametes polyzona]|nr:hypothetical protein C8Q77DRAFT_1057032 [Trametes polyzona]